MKSGIHAQGQSSHLGDSQGGGGGGGGGGGNGSEVCCLGVKRRCLLVWSGTIVVDFLQFQCFQGGKCGHSIFVEKELLNGTVKAGVFVFHGVVGARGLLELCLGSHCLSIKGSSSLTLLLHLRMPDSIGSGNLI